MSSHPFSSSVRGDELYARQSARSEALNALRPAALRLAETTFEAESRAAHAANLFDRGSAPGRSYYHALNELQTLQNDWLYFPSNFDLLADDRELRGLLALLQGQLAAAELNRDAWRRGTRNQFRAANECVELTVLIAWVETQLAQAVEVWAEFYDLAAQDCR